MSSPTAEKDRSGGGAKRSLPLIMVLPVAAFLVTCLYELLASSSAVLEASSVRVTGTLLVCCSIFSSLCWLAKRLLGFGGQVAAVAHALISEATRTRVAPTFLAVLFSALAALALFHSPETPVRYLLQGYLSYSLAITSVLAGLLTLLLSCRTLSHEIEAKLIETLAVKPVGRGSYLAGKWLGLVILNGILLSVAMSAIYIFSVHHIATLSPRDEKDAEAIEEEILTARDLVSAQADPPVAEQVETVKAIAETNGGGEFAWSNRPEERNKLWRARHDAYYAAVNLREGAIGWATDVCVPMSRLAECIAETHKDLATASMPATILGHVGDGNFHVVFSIDPDAPEEMREVEALNARLVERALAMDGTCTGEHGIGLGKQEWLVAELGDAVDEMRTIKRALDPDNLLNPGKIFSL